MKGKKRKIKKKNKDMTLSINCVPIEMTEVEYRDREVSL